MGVTIGFVRQCILRSVKLYLGISQCHEFKSVSVKSKGKKRYYKTNKTISGT